MIKIILLSVGGVLGLWSGYTVFYEGNLESPQYSVLEKEDGFELRSYESFRIAQTQRGSGEMELRQGFRTIARYIFGGNSENKSLSMTTPVIQENLQEGMNVSFVMSAKENQLPSPNSRDVALSEVNWGRVASLRFSGYASQEKFAAKETVLRAWIEKKGWKIRGNGIYAQYNSPSAFPLLRRNEVLLLLE